MEAENTRSMEPQHLDELEMQSKPKAAVGFNQGMRRLAIFAGALGAVAGGFYAHKDLHNVPSERYQHKVFEKLAASDIVKQKHAQRLLEAANGTPFFEDSSSDVDDQPNAITSPEQEIIPLAIERNPRYSWT